MDQFKEIPLLESLLNVQKVVLYICIILVNCSMQFTILCKCLWYDSQIKQSF